MARVTQPDPLQPRLPPRRKLQPPPVPPAHTQLTRSRSAMIVTPMKTTIELPDALLREARAVAARRRTTLKAVFTHALQREIRSAGAGQVSGVFIVDADGLPHLPARGVRITGELVARLAGED